MVDEDKMAKRSGTVAEVELMTEAAAIHYVKAEEDTALG